MNDIVPLYDHIIPKIVKAEFIISAVSYIRGVGLFSFGRAHVVLYNAHRKPEKLINGPHPHPVALCQVIVNRNDMHALAGKGVETRGKRCDQRFALAGGHFRDFPFVHDNSSYELHVKMPHAYCSFSHLPHNSERLGQDIFEYFIFYFFEPHLGFILFLGKSGFFYPPFQFRYFRMKGLHLIFYVRFKFIRFAAKILIRKF